MRFSEHAKIGAQTLIQLCHEQNIVITTAESCTGGLISSYLTSITGSSNIFEGGYVTYANSSKIRLLGVPKTMIENYGAVSKEVSIAMAQGALINSNATASISTTGIAGPSGGSAEKPVGLVHISFAFNGQKTIHALETFKGNRHTVRIKTVIRAINIAINGINSLV